jgi:hypothetical protein
MGTINICSTPVLFDVRGIDTVTGYTPSAGTYAHVRIIGAGAGTSGAVVSLATGSVNSEFGQTLALPQHNDIVIVVGETIKAISGAAYIEIKEIAL